MLTRARNMTAAIALLAAVATSTAGVTSVAKAADSVADVQQRIQQVDATIAQWQRYIDPRNLYSAVTTDATASACYNSDPNCKAAWDQWVAQQQAIGNQNIQELQQGRDYLVGALQQLQAQQLQNYFFPQQSGNTAAPGAGNAGASTGNARCSYSAVDLLGQCSDTPGQDLAH